MPIRKLVIQKETTPGCLLRDLLADRGLVVERQHPRQADPHDPSDDISALLETVGEQMFQIYRNQVRLEANER